MSVEVEFLRVLRNCMLYRSDTHNRRKAKGQSSWEVGAGSLH